MQGVTGVWGKGSALGMSLVTGTGGYATKHVESRKTDLALPVFAAAYDHANLVPAERRQVLDTDGLTDAQLGKGSGVLVIASLLLGSSGGSATVAILRLGLPFLGEGFLVGRDAGAKRAAKQMLARGSSCVGGNIAQLQETSGEHFCVNVAGESCLQHEVFHGFDSSVSVAIRLRVVRRCHYVVDAPALHEGLEVCAGELGPPSVRRSRGTPTSRM